MSSSSHKRPLSSGHILGPPSKSKKTNASSGPSTASLEKDLSLFTRERLQKLVLKLAKENATMANSIIKEVSIVKKAMSQAPAIDFQRHSTAIWHLLNTKYSRMSPRQQYDIAGDVVSEIEETISDEIVAKVNKEVCYGTKYNALVVLRKIAKSIFLAEEGELKKIVLNDGTPDTIVDAMLKVGGYMDKEERKKAMWSGDLLDKLEELEEFREGIYMDDLPKVLEMFGVGNGGGGDEEEEEEEPEEEEEMGGGNRLGLSALPTFSSTKVADPKRGMAIIDLTS